MPWRPPGSWRDRPEHGSRLEDEGFDAEWEESPLLRVTLSEERNMGNEREVRDLINDPRRIGVMATTNRQGDPNVAVFGSPHVPDDLTLVKGLGESRTAQNLLETGRAFFMTVLPAANPMETQGARICLRIRTMEKEGPNLESMKRKIRQAAGDRAAARIRYAVFFDIEETRPLIDWSPQSKAPLT